MHMMQSAPRAPTNAEPLWRLPTDIVARAEALRAASISAGNRSSLPSPKLVVRALDGPPDSDVGKGWLDYALPPAKQLDPFGFANVRLSLEGMDEMVVYRGYPLERHVTVTGDGYRLATFRIPYGAGGVDGPSRNGHGAARQPVLLLHGISLASTCWVVNEPEQSLAFLLADQGYDVWMINTRGNTFSREHERYSVTDSRFWRFSMDELAQDDLPAVARYVRMVTGATKLHMVGHSQGATIALAALANAPEEADGVGVLLALAPVVYVKYVQSVTMSAFCIQANSSILLRALPPQEFLFMGRSTQMLFLNGVCQTPAATQICVTATESLFGQSRHITTLQYRRYWQAWPSATSYWNAVQWSQMYNDPQPRFFRFNYGPEYELERVRARVIMVSGGMDVLSTTEDVALVSARLLAGGSLAGTYNIQDYGHMDIIWDLQAADRLYPQVINALHTYTQA